MGEGRSSETIRGGVGNFESLGFPDSGPFLQRLYINPQMFKSSRGNFRGDFPPSL